MNKKLKLTLSLALAVTMQGFAQNPFVQTCYTSDPAPMVHDGRMYVYTGHDEDGADFFWSGVSILPMIWSTGWIMVRLLLWNRSLGQMTVRGLPRLLNVMVNSIGISVLIPNFQVVWPLVWL